METENEESVSSNNQEQHSERPTTEKSDNDKETGDDEATDKKAESENNSETIQDTDGIEDGKDSNLVTDGEDSGAGCVSKPKDGEKIDGGDGSEDEDCETEEAGTTEAESTLDEEEELEELEEEEAEDEQGEEEIEEEEENEAIEEEEDEEEEMESEEEEEEEEDEDGEEEEEEEEEEREPKEQEVELAGKDLEEHSENELKERKLSASVSHEAPLADKGVTGTKGEQKKLVENEGRSTSKDDQEDKTAKENETPSGNENEHEKTLEEKEQSGKENDTAVDIEESNKNENKNGQEPALDKEKSDGEDQITSEKNDGIGMGDSVPEKQIVLENETVSGESGDKEQTEQENSNSSERKSISENSKKLAPSTSTKNPPKTKEPETGLRRSARVRLKKQRNSVASVKVEKKGGKQKVKKNSGASNLAEKRKAEALKEVGDSAVPTKKFCPGDAETEESNQEDFPTEGLLKELHFLNASCEKPSLSKSMLPQNLKTPKKQKKSDSKGFEDSRSTMSTEKRNRRKAPPVKRQKIDIEKFIRSRNVESDSSESSDESDDSSDEGSLQIVADDDNLGKRRASSHLKGRKKMRSVDSGDVPQEVIELIQSGIDEALEVKAERTHLTAVHVKNIIKNVMTDENVLAMVRNTVLGISTTDANSSTVYEPTLTRAKTKEIIQQQAEGFGRGSIWAELSKTTTTTVSSINPETRALVTTDFPEEDEDEEYTPENDRHIPSDDESFITTTMGSTQGSPSIPYTPTTPRSNYTPKSQLSVNTPGNLSDLDSPAQPVDRRVQLLKQKSAQRILNFEPPVEDEGLVSQRTRSKLPLKETPLECLEMAFKPPDVTDDMYESEVLDDDWKTFLIDFIHPLENVEGAEDEEADPEYNVLEDKEDVSDLREEMRGDRAVQISKKEINSLLTELLGTLDSDEEGTEPVRKHLSQHITQSPLRKRADKNIEESEEPAEEPVEPGPPPNVIWVEVLTAKFTPSQYDILRQQMAMHTQLLTTTVLLRDGLVSTTVADSATHMLEEMKATGVASDYSNTFFQASNLDAALDTLKRFKESGPSELRKKDSRSGRVDLSAKVIEAILESSAFPFPHMLPRRMLWDSRTNKIPYVPAEEMLIAMALDEHLSGENEGGKREKLKSQITSVLQESLKDSMIHKTVPQLQRRIRVIRSQMKQFIKEENPLAIYLDSCKLVNPPSASVEPLLPCIPCPVRNYPETALLEPWKKIVTVRRKKQLETSSKTQKRWTKELLFGGMRPLSQTVPKMVILQTEGLSTQVVLPTTLAPIAPTPSSSVSLIGFSSPQPLPTITVVSSAVKPATTVPGVSSSSAPFMSLSGKTIKIPVSKVEDNLGVNAEVPVSQASNRSESQVPSSKASSELSASSKNESLKSLPSNSGRKSSSSAKEDENKSSDGTYCSVSKERETETNPPLENLNEESNIPAENDSLENCLEPSLETPQKIQPSSLSLATPDLHMPSLLITPEKRTSDGVRNLSSVLLDDKIVTFETPDKSNDVQLPSLSPPQAVELDSTNLQGSSQESEETESSLKNLLNSCGVLNNSPNGKDSKTQNSSSLAGDKETEPENESFPISGIPISLHGATTTLVTSVYQSPIPSSSVGGAGSIRVIMNLSPQKTSPYRKISPKKILRSPIKTSPMKKISPILRKYGYRKKKRTAKKKLSPILPKITRIRASKQRSLIPKPPKEDPVKSVSLTISPPKVIVSNPVTRGTEVSTVTSTDSNANKPENNHQSEEEFEEDDLEEEEEEEEEDSEAAQQREEHLAALLKASSTIVGKRCDRLGGGEMGEKRLNKQQKRLQARITALSIVQDSVTKDQSMAQSYLMRVREALTGRDPFLYKRFLNILNEFTENATNSPVELYENLCEVLKDFPLLSEEFVSFLLPQQAIAIGKYSQYCAIHRMRDFLDKLKLQFRKQPQHIQKIVRLLQSLHNAPDLDFEKVKTAICPLLRYPHLMESFAYCFASQPPPPSLPDDFEEISLERSDTPDSVENVMLPDDEPVTSLDSCGCSCHISGFSPPTYIPSGNNASTNTSRNEHCQSCALRFSEGKVYLQYGKTLRPAKVMYHPLENEDSGKVENKDVEGSSREPHSDICSVMSKGKGTGTRKTSHQKESGDRARNKETNSANSANISHSYADGKGSTVAGDKGSKDDSTALNKQSSGKGRCSETEITDDCRSTSSSSRKESTGGRSSQQKRSKNTEKGDGSTYDRHSDLLNIYSTSLSGLGSKGKSIGTLETDSNAKIRKRILVASPPSKDTQKNEHNISSTSRSKGLIDLPVTPVAQTIVNPSVGDISKSLHSSQEKSGAFIKLSENLTSFENRKSVCGISNAQSVCFQIVSDISKLSSSSYRSVPEGAKKNYNVSKATSEKQSAPCVLANSSCEWTREEDRLILLTIQEKGVSGSIIQEVMKVIPNRTLSEVSERLNVLMKLMMEDSEMEDISLSSEDDGARD